MSLRQKRFAVLLAATAAVAVAEGRGAELVANPLNDLRKVLRDEPVPDWVRFGALPAKPWSQVAPYEPLEAARLKTARVALARQEFESVQIVLRAVGGDVRGVRIEVGGLREPQAGAEFPAAGVSVWQVGHVPMRSLWNPPHAGMRRAGISAPAPMSSWATNRPRHNGPSSGSRAWPSGNSPQEPAG